MRPPTTIQTYLFPVDTWTKPRARAWLERHRKVASSLTREGTHWHARQIDPSLFDRRSFRTIVLEPGLGLKVVVGHLHASNHTKRR